MFRNVVGRVTNHMVGEHLFYNNDAVYDFILDKLKKPSEITVL